MKYFRTFGATALAFCLALSFGTAQAAPKPLNIGLILSMSGPFSTYGNQIKRGIELYVAEHGDEVAGRQIKLLVEDDTGIAPQLAKRKAKQLIINDDVEILAGFDLTPNAFAAAPLATRAKVPMVVMNAATASITEKSPYIVRVSMTLAQGAWPMAQWAYNNDIRSVYILAADYGPGHGAAKQFQETFASLGGTIVDTVFTPVSTPDYAPYLQKVKEAKPDALFMFVPPGSSMVSLMKGYEKRGLGKDGIVKLGPGDMTDEETLSALGDAALGMVTAFHYAEAHESAANQAFVKTWYKAYPDQRPNFMAVAGYDGMHMIYQALEKTGGDTTAPAFIKAVEGMSWISPRGPVSIDADTREITQNEYIRKLERVDGQLQNIEFAVYKAVQDPAKTGGVLEDVEFEQFDAAAPSDQ